MAASTTNYVFLNMAANCVPASNTTGTPVAGIPVATVTTGAAAITAIADARTWFAARPVVDPGGQVYNVKAYGATGNGSTDDTATITAAITAAAAVGGRVYFPPGTYLISSPLPFVTSVTYEGASVTNGGGSMIVSSASDLFYVPGPGNTYNATIQNLNLGSQAGGGHVFNFSGTYGVASCWFHNLSLSQANPGKSIVYTGGNGLLGCHFESIIANYSTSNTVPAFYLVGSTINTDTFENMWITGGVNSSNYVFWLQTTSTAYVQQIDFENITFERPYGGAFNLLGAAYVRIANSGVYDTGTPVNPLVNLGTATEATSGVEFENDYLTSLSSTAVPDLAITTGQVLSINCLWNYITGMGSSPAPVQLVGRNAINHATNINTNSSLTTPTLVNPTVYGMATSNIGMPTTPPAFTDISATVTWQASTSYCYNTPGKAVIYDGQYFEWYTGCGVSGTTAPSWPANMTACGPGNTTVDGTAVATCLGTGSFAANTTYYLKDAYTSPSGTGKPGPEVTVTTANDGVAHVIALVGQSTYTVTGMIGAQVSCATASGNEQPISPPFTGAFSNYNSSGAINLVATNCTGSGSVQSVDTTGSIANAGNEIVGVHLNQSASNNFAGTCTMSSGTTCSFNLNASYATGTICIAGAQGTTATYNAACSVSGKTVSITASGSNSLTWGAILVGNPN
jgi:hypothetical protein